jgi:hypothetical protein
VLSANLMIVLELFGHAVMGEEGVQEGTKHAPQRGPSVEDQRGTCVVAYTYHLGRPFRNSRIQLQKVVFSPRVLSSDELRGHYGVER